MFYNNIMNKELEIYKQLLNEKNFKDIDLSFISYCKYIEEKNKELSNQVNLNEFVEQINSNKKELIKSLDRIKKQYIYNSDIHGIDHNIRVSLYGYYIGLRYGLAKCDMKLLLEACKYHDIGRVNDNEDIIHGFKSAKILDSFERFNKKDMKILLSMVTYHSVDDNLFLNIAKMFDVDDLDRLKILCNILKDSDALDRVRGGFRWGLDTKYLRTDISKEMVYLSYELLYNYEDIKSKRRMYDGK